MKLGQVLGDTTALKEKVRRDQEREARRRRQAEESRRRNKGLTIKYRNQEQA